MKEEQLAEKVLQLESALFLITLKMNKAEDNFKDLIYEHGGELADFNYRDTIHYAGMMAGLSLGDRYSELKEDHDKRSAEVAEYMKSRKDKPQGS